MADAFATPSDLEDRWRPLSSDEKARALTLLSDASDMVREEFRDIDARVESGAVMQSTLVRIVAGMVKRQMMNEGGTTARSVDDYREERDVQVASGYLFLSQFDRSALTSKRRRAFAVDLG